MSHSSQTFNSSAFSLRKSMETIIQMKHVAKFHKKIHFSEQSLKWKEKYQIEKHKLFNIFSTRKGERALRQSFSSRSTFDVLNLPPAEIFFSCHSFYYCNQKWWKSSKMSVFCSRLIPKVHLIWWEFYANLLISFFSYHSLSLSFVFLLATDTVFIPVNRMKSLLWH